MIENFKSGGGPFKALIKPIKTIAKGFKKLTELVVFIIEWFMKILDLFEYIIKPHRLIGAIIHGMMEGVKLIFTGTIGELSSGPKKAKIKRKTKPKKNNKYCYKTKFFKMLILILFPPLAIFVDKGIKGIVPIVISTILTFKFYYFPGLIFTSIYLLL